jgi:putative sigma-54 modulation protein
MSGHRRIIVAPRRWIPLPCTATSGFRLLSECQSRQADKEGGMRIDVKGRNCTVGDELRERITKRFEKVGRQVSPLAELQVELREERNPSIRDSQIAEATLRLKGATLRACSAADNMPQAVNLAADELTRQVKRHLEKRRPRRQPPKIEPRPATSQ